VKPSGATTAPLDSPRAIPEVSEPVFQPVSIEEGIRQVTNDLPFDYSSDFDGPRQSPSDDIIEFPMEIGWPKDSPRTTEMARKPFVSFSNQSFSLATTEAGTPTLKLQRAW
jgi:hypothetical protein